ncbi:MAG: shikimate kinase [Nitrospinota bacterium]
MKKGKRYQNVVVIGFKSSGKTRIGKLLAKNLGLEYIDIDTLIEDEHASSGNSPGNRPATVRGIYKKFGKEIFCKLESKALKKAARKRKSVISLGGGSPVNKSFKKADFINAAFVYLCASPAILYGRIKAKGLPPFLDKKRPLASFNELYKKRAPVYEKIADITVDNASGRPARVCDEIIKKLEEVYGG